MELVPYIIVASLDVALLASEVNMSIKQGYEPLGGLVVVDNDGCLEYYQAMIRKPAVDSGKAIPCPDCS